MTQLAKIEGATRALAEAKTLSDIVTIRTFADQAVQYAKAAKLGLEASNHAVELRLLAERKAGEALQGLGRGQGNRFTVEPDSVSASTSEYQAAIESAGVNERQARRWQEAARIDEADFTAAIEEIKAGGEELSTSRVMRTTAENRRKDRIQEITESPPMPSSRYRIWYADPPWMYGSDGSSTEGKQWGKAADHYPTMSIDELCQMGHDIQVSCEDDAVLFLWVTSPLLKDCFQVIDAWGFEYKTSFVWDKVKPGLGYYNSVRHELLLVCARGSCTPDASTRFDSVVSIERSAKHSEKPEEFRRIIDSLYTHGKRIELFARTKSEGWDVWGNEC